METKNEKRKWHKLYLFIQIHETKDISPENLQKFFVHFGINFKNCSEWQTLKLMLSSPEYKIRAKCLKNQMKYQMKSQ